MTQFFLLGLQICSVGIAVGTSVGVAVGIAVGTSIGVAVGIAVELKQIYKSKYFQATGVNTQTAPKQPYTIKFFGIST